MKKVLISIFSVVLMGCSFAVQAQSQSLSKSEAEDLSAELFVQEMVQYLETISQNWDEGVLVNGDFQMPFWGNIVGDKPEAGYPLYISMHGGGGAPKEVNDQQWENQKHLYGDVPGIYLVPRAPTDSWNMWHQEYMDGFLTQIISYAVYMLDADPDRVYLMGYSAGGDGTFNLAPRLSDRFAAAAMMAGHPGDAVVENLNNLPFAIYMGGEDSAYNRNGLAAEWGVKLDELSKQYPGEFEHRVVIYEGKGHWMDNEDKESIEWLAQWQRDVNPDHIIWVQDDVLAFSKYNLEVAEPKVGAKLEVTYDRELNRVNVLNSDYSSFKVWLNDNILDLDRDVELYLDGKLLFRGRVERNAENIATTAAQNFDVARVYSGCIEVAQ